MARDIAEKPAGQIIVEGKTFALRGTDIEYRFHINADGDLIHDHYGRPAPSLPPRDDTLTKGWGLPICESQRELPDSGRGDFRLPAFHIRHGSGTTVTHFTYKGYEILSGKPTLDGLPATFGLNANVSTLIIYLVDQVSKVEAELQYSVFGAHGAISRSFKLVNRSESTIEIQRAAPFSLDVLGEDWDLVKLHGDWGKETQMERTTINHGIQGFQNSSGYSSHYYNPFFALTSPSASEVSGKVYGFSLVWSGSFAVDVEKYAFGRTRAMIGLHPLHLAYSVQPGCSFQTPEVVSVFSKHGLGGMSRAFHRLFRDHLCRSRYVYQPRPTLLNSWEAVHCSFTDQDQMRIAKSAAELGVKLFVLDDGWFGNGKHARTKTDSGLGDWQPNKDRFPHGFASFVDSIISLKTTEGKPLQFGVWVEPEMVNPQSDLYQAHPEWVLHSGAHQRSTKRSQLVLNLALPAVQDFILDAMIHLLSSADIRYIKWDCNRGINELSRPLDAHDYILGLYRILDELNKRFPNVLFEGCASGGGRFDAGILYYWPQSWTSDNTDALDRLFIQFGTSLVYPASSMGCHVSACPNEQVGRTTPFEFRAHVAMMGGSFGFELDPTDLSDEERATIPALIEQSEKLNSTVVSGDMYRLVRPDQSNRPAVFYLARDGREGWLLAYQMQAMIRTDTGAIKLQGLNTMGMYEVQGVLMDGATLMNAGLQVKWECKDYQSKVIGVRRVD